MRQKTKSTIVGLTIASLLQSGTAYAQNSDMDAPVINTQTEATAEGIAYQAEMPPMALMRAMFLDLQASADQGIPVARQSNTFTAGERIAIYAKFAHVGRVYPGAVDGLMSLDTDVRVMDASGNVIVNQMATSPQMESVPYPYEGPIPTAYFESFKLNLMALPITGDFVITLTFHDRTRPATETGPVEVILEATIE